MTPEQNESPAQPQPGQQTMTPSQTQPGGQAPGYRRRRRKRKGGGPKPGQPQPGQLQTGQSPSDPAQPAAQNSFQSSPPAPQMNAPRDPQGQRPKQGKRVFGKSGGGGQGNGNYGNGGPPSRMNYGNGNGNTNGNGGGRRKGKAGRRQQVFVGPMDHSYRAGANGNIADSNGNSSNGEFRGMPHSGFFSETDIYSSAPAPLIREDAPVRIFFFIEDLFFLAKIQEISKKLGVKVGFLKADKETLSKLTEGGEETRPSLIVFDLNNANAKPMTMIPKIKAKLKRGTSIIGFLSHLQSDLKAKAVDAGCDIVMPRSAFSQNLPNLLRRHGLEEEELEAVEA